ncbi:MAG: hypothetical protein QNL62_18515 [Gammaproteobacteria bacterium]|nr:hypothetical protein [Gammaproteobacteria bacterium]
MVLQSSHFGLLAMKVAAREVDWPKIHSHYPKLSPVMEQVTDFIQALE